MPFLHEMLQTYEDGEIMNNCCSIIIFPYPRPIYSNLLKHLIIRPKIFITFGYYLC